MSVLSSLLSSSVSSLSPNQSGLLNPKLESKTELEKVLNTKLTCFNLPRNYKQINWTWSKQKSEKILYSNDSKSVCLHAFCSGCFQTEAIRVEQELKRNAYTFWQVEVSREALSGTSTMIGVGRARIELNSNGYLNLLGQDENSWALSTKGYLFHNGMSFKFCEQFSDENSIQIGCLFDGFNGRLSYFVNGRFIGVAFDNISLNEPVYAMVSSTVSSSVFRLQFACEHFASLQEICRSKIIQSNQAIDKSILMPKIILDF